MPLKKVLSIFFISISFYTVFAAEPTVNYKLYGFVRNDFYINSRQNVEALDGLFNIFPKPVDLNGSGEDKNAVPNAEMLSVATRLGLDFTGTTLLGAKSSAKIECDFAGISTSYYLIRIRQAYMKLNWENTELLVGQTWHPMFGNVMPAVPSLNTGSPFQPFNRSPQIRLKQALGEKFSLIAAAAYQMQYMSQGPNGTSASYLKNALLPNLYVGFENKSNNWTTGIGFDTKTIKINHEKLTSTSATAYTQFVQKAVQIKAKVIYGENLSDHLMIGGYGVSGTNSTTNEPTYSNLNTLSSWLNVVYGSKVQIGIFTGISQNLGANLELRSGSTGKYTIYGYGFYSESQQLVDRLFRIAPHVSYNLSNFKLAAEYELTSAQYGNIQSNGRVSNSYSVNNHRFMATISYLF
ncbi:MAG: hypothetical protein LLF95_05815 [Bacteroidales bacterium]|nr:hypothetical protein [Bacteroidales bacterium]